MMQQGAHVEILARQNLAPIPGREDNSVLCHLSESSIIQLTRHSLAILKDYIEIKRVNSENRLATLHKAREEIATQVIGTLKCLHLRPICHSTHGTFAKIIKPKTLPLHMDERVHSTYI